MHTVPQRADQVFSANVALQNVHSLRQRTVENRERREAIDAIVSSVSANRENNQRIPTTTFLLRVTLERPTRPVSCKKT